MRFGLVALLVGALVAPGPARAAPGAVVVAAGYSYLPGGDRIAGGAVPGATEPVVIPEGTDVVFANLESLAPDVHSMTATSCTGVEEPCWFDTSDPSPQQVGEAVVVPTASLPPGTYQFFCVAHSVMRGTLVVLNSP